MLMIATFLFTESLTLRTETHMENNIKFISYC